MRLAYFTTTAGLDMDLAARIFDAAGVARTGQALTPRRQLADNDPLTEKLSEVAANKTVEPSPSCRPEPNDCDSRTRSKAKIFAPATQESTRPPGPKLKLVPNDRLDLFAIIAKHDDDPAWSGIAAAAKWALNAGAKASDLAELVRYADANPPGSSTQAINKPVPWFRKIARLLVEKSSASVQREEPAERRGGRIKELYLMAEDAVPCPAELRMAWN